MSVFLIHSGDGREDGEIHQSSKIYDWAARTDDEKTAYLDRLAELGQRHIVVESQRPLDIERYFVNASGEPKARPIMPIGVARLSVAAGEKDAVRFTGIPTPCRLAVFAVGFETAPISDMQITVSSIDVSLPVPGGYVFRFEKFPFVTWESRVEAK